MVSADTNVIVRLLVGDDKSQSEKAKRLFEEEKIFIATTVVLECEWVLRYAYHFEPIRIADAFQALFGLPNVTLQEQAVVADAIAWHQQGMDFADAMHLAASRHCDSFATFDRKFIKSAKKITPFKIQEP
ncbi:putative nucleic-acid-binding protein, contains PIN domain [Candidatus Electrothrix marina]|uniref:Putative nucleic-acid-binding protein, contains PIN domain n=1 Tax=Candidatus Electrothrix marina TaxID=1859130 RepID=A0A444JFW1_9BACT|nr:putative nucleic-acid-binding protein, contains PIN domain [Candidatus Electrothrix marina]